MQDTLIIVRAFIFSVLICTTALISYNQGFDKGFNSGLDNGFGLMADTVNNILDAQIKSDTSRTRLTIVNPDTNSYFLSRKTVLNKHKK